MSKPSLFFQSSTPASEKAILSFSTEHQFNDFLTLNPEYKSSYVFIDGSTKPYMKSPSAGLGYLVSIDGPIVIGGAIIDPPCTSDMAELKALLHILPFLSEVEKPLLICTDSSYIYKSIAYGWSHRLAIEDHRPHTTEWEAVLRLWKTNFKIVHVESHVRNSTFGIQTADFMARAFSQRFLSDTFFNTNATTTKDALNAARSILLEYEVQLRRKV
uniref:RNase H domain-containing protein n=1 Tax=Strongyloides venezuelensis TaxID=75913 RepID=A0A0K0FHY1_STRVS